MEPNCSYHRDLPVRVLAVLAAAKVVVLVVVVVVVVVEAEAALVASRIIDRESLAMFRLI